MDLQLFMVIFVLLLFLWWMCGPFYRLAGRAWSLKDATYNPSGVEGTDPGLPLPADQLPKSTATSSREDEAHSDQLPGAPSFVKERRIMQIIGAFGCIAVSAGIGWEYVILSTIERWQLWAWLVSIVTITVLLIPANRPSLHLRELWGRLPHWAWLSLLGIAALGLRVTALETIPGGFHSDEFQTAELTLHQVFPPDINETLNPFGTGSNSQPALFHYLLWISFKLFGSSITSARLLGAIAGALAVVATFVVVAVFQGRRVAFIAALIMLTYHYHIHWSRIALNNIWDTLWVPLIIASFAWGWRTRWSGGAVIAGLALGFSQYFYAGSKIAIFLVAFLVLKFWLEKADRSKLIAYVGKLALTAACVALPIVFFALRNPELYFARTKTVYGWQEAVILDMIGEPATFSRYLIFQIWHSVGAFAIFPDVTGFYGPGVPLLIGIAAPLFFIGFFWAIYQRQFVPVLWIVLTLVFGGIMLSGAPSSSHLVVMIPAICWLLAMPINWLLEQGRRRLALTIIPVILLTDLFFYFMVYVPSQPRDLTSSFPTLLP